MNTQWNHIRLCIICMLALLISAITSGELMAAPNCAQHYSVRPGDTLGHIAQRFGVTIGQLQSVNNIRNANHIYSGQQLCVQPGMGGTEADTTDVTRIQAVTTVNVRTGPSLQHMIVGRLAKNAIAEVVGRSNDGQWWQITCPVGEGSGCWVTAQRRFTRPVGPQSPAPIPQTPAILGTGVTAVTVLPERALLYAGPGTQYAVVGSMFGGLPIPVDGVSVDGNWWHASCPDASGAAQCDYWASADPQITQPIRFP